MNRKISFSFAVVLYMVGFSVWAGTFEVHAPMVRMVPPGQAVSVAFLGLVNHGDKDRAIVAAYSDVASVAGQLSKTYKTVRLQQSQLYFLIKI